MVVITISDIVGLIVLGIVILGFIIYVLSTFKDYLVNKFRKKKGE